MPLDVVLVTVDTLRADHVGCYGYGPADTPFLDGLAARGLAFDDATTTAPLTLPAHTSLLSGRWVHDHRVHGNASRVPPELELLPDRLSAAGYATAAFVSGRPLSAPSGLGAHFDRLDDHLPDALAGRAAPPERRAAHTVDAATAWLGTAPEPFFLWVHLYDPHQPHTATHTGGDPYDDEIRDVDQAIGSLLAALALRGVDDRTAIVVVGDHGEGLGDHGEPEHGVLMYQATLRVPLVVAGPGVAPGRRAEPVSVVDVAPTVLAWAGLREDLPGVDLRGPVPADRPLFAATTLGWERYGWAPLGAVRKGPYKAIDAPRPELYDLRADPGEQRNLWPGDGSWAPLLRAVDARSLPGDDAPVPRDLAAQLVALGYAASEPAPVDAAPDPKDRAMLLPAIGEASAALQAGDAARAERLASRVVAADPTNPAALNDLGMALLVLGRPAEAARALGRAAERTPNDPMLWNNLGLAAARAGDRTTARAAYARSSELDPTFAAPCFNRANLEYADGDLAAARRWVDEALRRDPAMPEARQLRALVP